MGTPGKPKISQGSARLTEPRNKLDLCLQTLDGHLAKAIGALQAARDADGAAGQEAAELLQGAATKLSSIIDSSRKVPPYPTKLVCLAERLEQLLRLCGSGWEDESRAAGVQHHVNLLICLTCYCTHWRDADRETLPESVRDQGEETVRRVFDHWVACLSLPKDPSDPEPSKDAAAYATRFWTSLDQYTFVPLTELIADWDHLFFSNFLQGVLKEIERTGAAAHHHFDPAATFISSLTRSFRHDGLPGTVTDVLGAILERIAALIDECIPADEELFQKRLHCLSLFLRALGLGDGKDSIRNQLREPITELKQHICRWRYQHPDPFGRRIVSDFDYEYLYVAVTGAMTCYPDRHKLAVPFHPDAPCKIHEGPVFDFLSLDPAWDAIRLKLPASACQASMADIPSDEFLLIRMDDETLVPMRNCKFVVPFNDGQAAGQIRFLILDKVHLYSDLDLNQDQDDFLILAKPLSLTIASSRAQLEAVASGSARPTEIDRHDNAWGSLVEFVHTRHGFTLEWPSDIPVLTC